MPAPVASALIVGGGFSGLTAAIMLRRLGIDVDLVEIDPEGRTYGAGISIGGPALRALRTIGVLERFLAEGYAADGTEVRSADGQLLAQLPTPRVAGPDVPGNGAIMRPVLASILRDAAIAAGVSIQLGCTFRSLEPQDHVVEAELSDGRRQRYDLVIGADGLRSSVRRAIFPHAPEPRYSGQGVWRAVLPKPADINCTVLWIGADTKVGVNPVSRNAMYLFVNENRRDNRRIGEDEFLPTLKGLLVPFRAPEVQLIREQLSDESQINFRPLECLLLPRPWHRGRVVLIGDAVHATTPHLAAGAGIGIEDAIVLAEEIGRRESGEEALDAFEKRRWDRCRMVVENSGRLGEIETHGGNRDEHAALMRDSFLALAEAI